MIRNLAYAGFISPNAAEWRAFGPDVLGAQVVDGADDAVRLRIDDRAWRIAVHPGEHDDIAYFGWAVTDDEIAGTIERAEGFGCTVHVDDALAAERQVGRLAWFEDPFGVRHELIDEIAGPEVFTPGRSMEGPFVTGEQGLGHVVLVLPDAERGREFVTGVLGMALSDVITTGPVVVDFYHCRTSEARHHTLATMSIPGMVGFFHLMLEVAEIDDVGRALDRVKKLKMTLPMDLGKHPNDLMTSFYVRGPSGFDIEYGTGGLVVDDADWEVGAYDHVSLWGHRAPDGGPPPPGIMRPAG